MDFLAGQAALTLSSPVCLPDRLSFSRTNTSSYSGVFLASGLLLGTDYFFDKSNNKQVFEEIL